MSKVKDVKARKFGRENFTNLADLAGNVLDWKTVESDYSIRRNDGVINVDATDGPVGIILPDPAEYKNRVFSVKKIDSSGNAVTIDAGDSTIDRASTLSVSVQYDAPEIGSDGVEWWIK